MGKRLVHFCPSPHLRSSSCGATSWPESLGKSTNKPPTSIMTSDGIWVIMPVYMPVPRTSAWSKWSTLAVMASKPASLVSSAIFEDQCFHTLLHIVGFYFALEDVWKPLQRTQRVSTFLQQKSKQHDLQHAGLGGRYAKSASLDWICLKNWRSPNKLHLNHWCSLLFSQDKDPLWTPQTAWKGAPFQPKSAWLCLQIMRPPSTSFARERQHT